MKLYKFEFLAVIKQNVCYTIQNVKKKSGNFFKDIIILSLQYRMFTSNNIDSIDVKNKATPNLIMIRFS